MNSLHPPQIHRPAIFKSEPSLVAAESTRIGGVSPPPYVSLNLGWHTDDTDANVHENRRRLCQALQIDLAHLTGAYQVHGDQILLVHQAGYYQGYDALICNQPNIILSVTTADCTPVLVCDIKQKAVAAIHAGWKGTSAEIVRKTIEKMQYAFDTQPRDCLAYIGSCIDECSFEVDADVGTQFESPFCIWDEDRGKYLIDLKKLNQQQLLDAGVPIQQIECSPFSTVLHNDRYFSHRKEGGKTGRMLAVIGYRS